MLQYCTYVALANVGGPGLKWERKGDIKLIMASTVNPNTRNIFGHFDSSPNSISGRQQWISSRPLALIGPK